jgi:hypothetical protein
MVLLLLLSAAVKLLLLLKLHVFAKLFPQQNLASKNSL